jgi:hypothetical protein|tara:strand:- start:48 stop:224 length:177 start_codon:yes stop_codon:yes gene_type:complete
MATITIGQAIKSLNADAEYKFFDHDWENTIEWLNGTTPISNSDIKAEQERLQAIEDAK